MKNIKKISILGIKLDPLDRYQSLSRIEEFFFKKTPSLICTINVEFIMTAQRNEEFKNVLNNKSALNTLDGSGVIWAYKLLSSWKPKTKVIRELYIFLQWLIYLILFPIFSAWATRSIPKISGADFVWDICQWASDNNKKIFILGNKAGLDPNSAQKASLELQTKIYNLKIVGAQSILPEESDNKSLVESIKKSGADILFCALGSPLQEIWLAKNLGRSGAQIGIGLGGTFDFIAGVQKRAPRFMSLFGLEWLYRLVRQPKRIKRQVALPRFTVAILKERLSAEYDR